MIIHGPYHVVWEPRATLPVEWKDESALGFRLNTNSFAGARLNSRKGSARDFDTTAYDAPPHGQTIAQCRPARINDSACPRNELRDGGTSRYLRTGGLVLRQVGTPFVTPTEAQLYDPTEGPVTVRTDVPDVP